MKMKKIFSILLFTAFFHFMYGGAPIFHSFNSNNLNLIVGEQVIFMSTITNENRCSDPTLLWDFGPNAIPSTFNMTFPVSNLIAFNLPVAFSVPGTYNVSQTLMSPCSTNSIFLQVIVASPLNIPTLSQWCLFVLGILIMIFGAITLKSTYKSKQNLSS